MSEKQPECCEKCINRFSSFCCNITDGKATCKRWQEWFNRKWKSIRESAERMKKENEQNRKV